MNCIVLIGTVVAPVAYFCTKEGRDVTRIQLSVPAGAGCGSVTAIHHCRAWGPAAIDLHEHLAEGDRLLVRGDLRYRQRTLSGGERVEVPLIQIASYSYLGRGSITRRYN